MSSILILTEANIKILMLPYNYLFTDHQNMGRPFYIVNIEKREAEWICIQVYRRHVHSEWEFFLCMHKKSLKIFIYLIIINVLMPLMNEVSVSTGRGIGLCLVTHLKMTNSRLCIFLCDNGPFWSTYDGFIMR